MLAPVQLTVVVPVQAASASTGTIPAPTSATSMPVGTRNAGRAFARFLFEPMRIRIITPSHKENRSRRNSLSRIGMPKENTGMRYSIFFGKYLPVTKHERMAELATNEN
ncbi:hypothetical protein [Burkholderia contaminans]|uniref:hypothetical protein n=1 Tax=Burkholderia contaminans TaxID=488447 RepID=UPI002010CD64|nr:hypothetical protein [Burkholderia contaminans]